MTARVGISIDPPGAFLAYEKKKLRAVMRGALGEVKDEAKRRLAARAGAGRIYRGSGGGTAVNAAIGRAYGKGNYQASAPGESPVSVTGALAKSLKVKLYRSGEGGTVSAAFYDLFLEYGASGGGRSFTVGPDGRSYMRGGAGKGKARVLEPRPLLTAVLDARGPSISRRVAEAVAQDIKFVKQKAP